METTWGQLVKVATAGPVIDGIVFDIPSASKVTVAVVDPSRGPVFRHVHPDTLSERDAEGPVDGPLQALIRRTPAPARGAGNGSSGATRGSAGHSRGASHRTTGR